MRKVILKLSGEVLAGGKSFGIDDDFLDQLSIIISKVQNSGVGIGIVVGAGNFWRGRQTDTMNKAYADHMGMLATVMNSIAIHDALTRNGVKCSHYTAVGIESIGERYTVAKANNSLENGEVIIISGGTGSPYFTTDSGAALRACELGAEEILLAKKVDGVYDMDPEKHANAKKFDKISYDEIFNRKLGVFDLTAAIMCMENHISLRVFSLREPENILKAAKKEDIGTYVYSQ